jgi:hypothetical protein
MHLIQNNHFARKTELPDEEMFGGDDAQQRLVNCSNSKRCKQCSFS